MRSLEIFFVLSFLSLSRGAYHAPVRRQDSSSIPATGSIGEATSVLQSILSSATAGSSAASSQASSSSSASSESSSSASSSSSSSFSSAASSSASSAAAGNATSSSAPQSSSTTSVSTVSASAAPSPTPVYAPQGGIGLNSTPSYKPQSDFDFQSLNLALHQELIELDLFRHGIAVYNQSDFTNAGLNAQDMYLLQFMANQEVAHATLISNILYPNVTQPCTYVYPNFTDLRAYIDFCQRLTRWGESGVYGFLGHLNAQDTVSLLMDSIATEARQQMIFRQFEGLFPMPYDFVPSITQSMTWTLLAPFIQSCPQGNPTVKWQNFPALTILNNPYWPDLPLDNSSQPAITQNRSQVTYPGREVSLSWETPGKQVGFNNSFTTNSTAGQAQFVAWISQLNTTYTTLNNINGTNATTIQPGGTVFENSTSSLINGTMYLLITDAAPYVTPYNLSQIEPHIVAGPAIYQAG